MHRLQLRLGVFPFLFELANTTFQMDFGVHIRLTRLRLELIDVSLSSIQLGPKFLLASILLTHGLFLAGLLHAQLLPQAEWHR